MGRFADGIPDVLAKIAAYKADEVAELRARVSEAELLRRAWERPAPLGFHDALRGPGTALIAEVKKASPSKGVIREDFDPAAIARAYQAGGAAALSCLTDGPGFGGSEAVFKEVREASGLPVLRKDFMLHPIQIAESRAMGADAVLVILAMIDDVAAGELMAASRELGMDALVETHDEGEMERAMGLGAELVGINNRDLRTFDTTLETFVRMGPALPDGMTLVAESGIFTAEDVARVREAGADAVLVGESLMRELDVEAAVRRLMV